MEDKKRPASPPPPSPPPSSLVADLFGAKNPPNPSPSPPLFRSVFPPAPGVMGRDSSRADIFDPSGKGERQNQALDTKNVGADDKSEGNTQIDKNPPYQQARIDPCSLSSSLYYGGRDIYVTPSSVPNFVDDYKMDGDDDSNDPDAACRGNWWQGSLYY